MNFNPICRRTALKRLGLSGISLPILSQTSSLFGKPASNVQPKQRLVIMFTPNGIIPDQFWPEKIGEDFEHRAILKPLEPFHDKMLVLKDLHNKVRGDGDDHMRGMGCLLTGIELFSGNIMGGANTPAGWPRGISIDREISNFLQSKLETRTRFGSLHFGVGVLDRADPWTRMSYYGPNQPVSPLSDPYDAYSKLYGKVREKKKVRSVLDDLKNDLGKVAGMIPHSDRKLLIDHAKLVERMDREYATASKMSSVFSNPPELPEGLGNLNDNLPQLGRLQIDLLVNALVNDFARVATLQFTKSVGQAKMRWLDIEDKHHTLSHEPDKNRDAYEKLVRINTWFAEELAYLLNTLESTPEPGHKGTMLDHTLVIWTNELGKGNSHTLNNIPFILVGGGLGFRMGRSMCCDNSAHNRLLLSLAHGFGHTIPTFGNPNLCQDGPLDLS